MRGNAIFNGSFETNGGAGCANTSYVDMSVGNTCISNWSVVSGTVDYVNAGLWDAENGSYSIDLSGVNNGAIAQSFTSVVGQQYTVTYWLAGNYAALPTIKTMEVSAAGQSQDDTFDTTGKSARDMGYVQESFVFIANSTTTTLEFASIDVPNSDGGPVLDNVTVLATPEPGTLALLSLGLSGAGFGSIIRRRRSH